MSNPRGELSNKQELPAVHLPGGDITVTQFAGKMGALFAATGQYYTRGGKVVRLDKGNELTLTIVRSAEMVTAFESVASLRKKKGENSIPDICNEQTAKITLES